MTLQLSYEEIKLLYESGQVQLKYIDRGDRYLLFATDSSFQAQCLLRTEADRADFDQYIKPQLTNILNPVDADGVPLSRGKITRSGWHYQVHAIRFVTGRADLLSSQLFSGSQIGITTCTVTDVGGGLSRTTINWEPTWDTEILGGQLFQLSVPASQVLVWCTGAPDIPSQYGGTVRFLQGGVDLRMLGPDGLRMDGRAPKFSPYNAQLHTGKFQLIIEHPTGLEHPMQFLIDIYKSGIT